MNNSFHHRAVLDTELLMAAEVARCTIGVAAPHVPRRSVLQVGAGGGHLLAVLRACGWRIHGVELSPEAYELACGHFELPMFLGSLDGWLESSLFRPFPMVIYLGNREDDRISPEFASWLYRAVEADGILLLRNGLSANQLLLHSGEFEILCEYQCSFADVAQYRMPADAFPQESPRPLLGATTGAIGLGHPGMLPNPGHAADDSPGIAQARRYLSMQPEFSSASAAGRLIGGSDADSIVIARRNRGPSVIPARRRDSTERMFQAVRDVSRGDFSS